jgi:hypothetical protein
MADGNQPSVGKIHYYAAKAQTALQAWGENEDQEPLPAGVQDAVIGIWRKRWDQFTTPLQGAAYCMDPEFWSDPGLSIGNSVDSCVTHFRTMLGVLMTDDRDGQKAARLQYSAFRAREGPWAAGYDAAVEDAPDMPADQWWQSYGGHAEELSKVATRILSQPSSASSCERAWSAYDFIHNKRRNRLSPTRARDLVYVFTNGRLARKFSQGIASEQFIGWDDMEEEDN